MGLATNISSYPQVLYSLKNADISNISDFKVNGLRFDKTQMPMPKEQRY